MKDGNSRLPACFLRNHFENAFFLEGDWFAEALLLAR
jgi:hypothetical protein